MRSSGTSKNKLLFITQKIHQDDDDLAFVILWVKEFIKQGFDVQVICLEKISFDGSFPVYSLGKELGYGRLRRAARFVRLIGMLQYERVFVHMNPEYVTLGGWYWFLRRIPIYLWYTHYTMHVHLWLSGILCKRLFAATAQSLPQYEKSKKKVVVGHGIDISFWDRRPQVGIRPSPVEYEILTVHRICRSKRLELTIQSLCFLPKNYTLEIYGRDVEKDYYQEIKHLIITNTLQDRVFLKGPVPMHELHAIYSRFRLMINMASETIDKTMLEGMLFGIYPVTTPANSRAIGLPFYPEDEAPQSIARFVTEGVWKQCDVDCLRRIVTQRHSLPSLIQKMGVYIQLGN